MRISGMALLGALMLPAASGMAAEAYDQYGAQHRHTTATQPSQAAVDNALRGQAQINQDRAQEDILQQREAGAAAYGGYQPGRRAEVGDRFRYGADRTPDDYARANAPDRFPQDTRPGIDPSGNVIRPFPRGTVSGSRSTTTTTTQSQTIDASGNLQRP